MDYFNRADKVISTAYPGEEMGLWGARRIPNHGLLRGAIATAIKRAYEQGLMDGATKQAILELQGRDRFLEELHG